MKETVKRLTEACMKQQLDADSFAAKYKLSNKSGDAGRGAQEEAEDSGAGVLI